MAEEFKRNLLDKNNDMIIKFLISQNSSGSSEDEVNSKILCLMDATGSM